MLKSLLLSLTLLSHLNGDSITGFWKTITDVEPHQPETIIAIYDYKGKYYGRLIGGFDDKGVISDNIYHPLQHTHQLVGDPPLAGLDVIWNLEKKDDHYFGEGVDPRTGFVYETELWREGPDLIVEGTLFFITRQQTWVPPVPSDYPPDFKKPDLSTFIPNIPKVKSVRELETSK
jgi:hypothetical protein